MHLDFFMQLKVFKSYKKYFLKLRQTFILIVIGCMTLISSTISARSISQTEKCLRLSNTIPRQCIESSLKIKEIPHCYQFAKSIKSTLAKEVVYSYCFYEISDFPNLNLCIKSATKFNQAVNKDAALFECYRQFAGSLNTKQCYSIADQMTFSDKKIYLKQGCDNL